MGSNRKRHGSTAWFGAALLLIVVCQREALSAGAPVMATQGSATVGADGHVGYDVKIVVPPGTTRSAPVLTLDYHSQYAGDLLGPGWALAGLYSIDWCPANAEAASAKNPATYFCMEGARLIAIHGAYGADGTEYRTQPDQFARIISRGSVGTGIPAWFEVHFKDGLIMQIGNSPDSREVNPDRVTRWWENKTADVMGTYITTSYAADPKDGSRYPVSIDYNGNDATHLQPYNAIRFSYENAPLLRDGGRIPLRGSLHMTDVKVYGDAMLVGEYRMSYRADGHLQAITRCDGAGHCLPPLAFAWQDVGRPRYGAPSEHVVLMSSASDGLGASERFIYAPAPPLTTGQVYFVCKDFASYPDYVVVRDDKDDGIGGIHSTLYAYEEGRMDLKEDGFFSFGKYVVSDPQDNRANTYIYGQDAPTAGQLITATTAYDGKPTRRITTSYSTLDAIPGTTARHVATEVTETWDLDGTPEPTETKTYAYDDWGNVTRLMVAYSDGWSKMTDNVYSNDVDRWYLGRLLRTTVHADTEGSHMMRISSFQYDRTTGLLTQEVIEPDLPASRLQTDYTYDAYGERVIKTTSGVDIKTRARKAAYDAKERYRISETDQENKTNYWNYDPVSGKVVRHAYPDGIIQQWSYDGFGRLISGENDEGSDGTTSYTYCAGRGGESALCPGGAVFFAETRPDGKSSTANLITYYDVLSHVIAIKAMLTNGTAYLSNIRNDAEGRIIRRCGPNLESTPATGCQNWQYDALGRVVLYTAADGGKSTVVYHSLATTVTDTDGKAHTSIRNGRGLVVETISDGKVTKIVYDAYGKPVRTISPDGKVATMKYDQRGNLIEQSDATGTSRFTYDVLGDLLHESHDYKSSTTRVSPQQVDHDDTRF